VAEARERRARRLLRLLLALYPAAFRRDLGDDLIETLLVRWRLAAEQGWRARAGFWLTDGARFAIDGVLERATALAQAGHDVRGALRQVRRAPAFHALVVLTVALGIGASTTMFTVADAVVFRSLPYPGADGLYVLHSRFGEMTVASSSLPNLADLREATGAFSWLAAARNRSPALTGGAGDPERVVAVEATEGYLDGLGARVVLGRPVLPADHRAGAPPVAVLSWSLWQRRFGGDPAVLGTSVLLDDTAHTVVGVLDRRFRDPGPVEAWAPTALWVPVRAADPPWSERGSYSFTPLARVAPGVALEIAESEGSRIGALLAAGHPEDNMLDGRPLELTLRPLLELTVSEQARLRVLLILGASTLLLALACVNVANLLVARGDARRAELAVRSALGAGRGRLARQLLVESLVTSTLGGAAGLAVAALSLRAFRALAPAEIPRVHEIGLDLRALLFVALATLAVGMAFGTLPAWRAVERVHGARATADRRSQRTQSGLVALQTALALVLVAGSVLLLASFRNLRLTDPGFDPADLLVTEVRAPALPSETGRQRAFYRDLLERARALPGVEHAALSYTVPARPGGAFGRVKLEGETPEHIAQTFFRFDPVGGDLFATLRVPLRSGSGALGDVEAGDPPVAVLNETAARELFPDAADPVGLRLRIGGSDDSPLREVIGVVADVRQGGPAKEPGAEIYLPYSQQHVPRLLLTLRTKPGLPAPIDEVRALVRELAPGVPIDDQRTMDDLIAASIADQRFLTALVTAFGALALLLAVVGTYSTAACVAARRRRELGIRQALGARRRTLVARASRQSATVAATGIAAGLVATWLLSRWLESSLFGLSTLDPRSLALACAMLAGAAVAAALGPAVRAARVDPAEILRAE
jgi:putative ABC transport system permease protein